MTLAQNYDLLKTLQEVTGHIQRPQMPEEPGLKFDDGKPRMDLIPYDSLLELSHIYTGGAKKYGENNWRKGLAWGRIFAAMMRHAIAFWLGEDNDPESGRPHMAHVAWGAFTLLHYGKTHPELDDRFTTKG